MKHIGCIAFAAALILSITACSSHEPTWQEEYDLGIRYLSEGNYEEAIIAFTAAIEIDPKQARAYVGRGDAYIGLGETGENLTAAIDDYNAALDLDDTNAEIYLKLADAYIAQGDYDSAIEILKLGMQKCPSDEIEQKLAAITANASRIILDKSYINRETLQNARPTIGGRDFINMSYDEIAAYYGVQKDEYASDAQYADTEQGPYDPDPCICIQRVEECLYVYYVSRQGVGIRTEKNQPEF